MSEQNSRTTNFVPHWKVNKRLSIKFNKTNVLKLYLNNLLKIFPGKYCFLWDGRIHTSQSWFAIPGVLALIIVPAGFHIGFEYKHEFD